jgi:hypothetical protein
MFETPEQKPRREIDADLSAAGREWFLLPCWEKESECGRPSVIIRYVACTDTKAKPKREVRRKKS